MFYLIGVGVAWLFTACAVKAEPTVHGQDVLVSMGCLLGLFWPLAIVYLTVISPWIALSWWQTRGERK